ncbi:AAA family ATPase [Candidatus Woesearchaeota archaeon]|nr:AAA family ATPase [Candidatus Woesearchaeota archaeon]
MKVIIVSGSVGTGKTTIAKKIAKEKNYKYVDINNLIIKNKLHQGYDKKLKTRLVDTKILNNQKQKLMKTWNPRSWIFALLKLWKTSIR